ncbi:corticoliberin isoform X1 [Xenopus laevis]|uniref:Corticoliberin isoform X1 n=2 Tax=Xenopus laevis TaxID=8355 RepID=A0A8J1KY09_XENLA|nr:corticoliberin isoform X1 [Xenopus laevis]
MLQWYSPSTSQTQGDAQLCFCNSPHCPFPCAVPIHSKDPCASVFSDLRSLECNMKFQLWVSTGILLVSLLPCHECRAFIKSPASSPGALLPALSNSQPFLLRMGEEYFLRLGNLHKHSPGSFPEASAGNFVRAVQQLQAQQWSSQPGMRAAALDGADSPYSAQEDPTEKAKRAEEPPISLDLTFHLLREVLEMARAEQIAQQAHSNRKLMDIIGK